ncbi:hypothetical protein FQN54_001593 [Arachnomyces sp. PD_36]|nr:hypothetical protein FQN54_001593 [Arachnomyces sp. PD_36]
MPSRLSAPLLTVDAGKMHKVDTTNPENLHGMWMVFSKCADYMEEGRRLENLSWRLWNRETFCVEPPKQSTVAVPTTTAASSQTLDVPRPGLESREIPELSASVESAASDTVDRIENHIKCPSSTLDFKPAIEGEDSSLSLSRGKEKHITSLGLERMVLNIKEKKTLEPFTTSIAPMIDITPRPSSPTPTPAPNQTAVPTPTPAPAPAPATRPSLITPSGPHQSSDSCSTAALDINESDRGTVAGSDTSVSSAGLVNSSSVVRGFSPSHISSYRSHPKLATDPLPAKSALQPKPDPLKKTSKIFTLGGSSGDDESSFEDRMVAHPHAPARSSLSDGLSKSELTRKVASFKDEVELRTIRPIREGTDEDAIESDDGVSESAIEEEDDSDWEDSVSESGRSSVDEKQLFQRVDSKPNLVSRPSLLTMMMHPSDRSGRGNGKMNGGGSRSTPALQNSRLPANESSLATSPEEDDESTLTMRGPDVPRSKPIVVKSSSSHHLAHSPRTTRRNMLATELTESLRRHLLWERQQKSTTANAVFKRRHTAHDMANLQEYPDPKTTQPGQNAPVAANETGAPSRDKETSKNSSWNHYFDHGPWEYHVKGW